MVTKKIFLASSRELEQDRNDFEVLISRKNNDWVDRGVYLKLIKWENFLDAMSETRLQDEYNKEIRECDIFVMLFWTKVGQYTDEEFETAYRQFQTTNKPFIFTYFKDAEISTGSANKKDLMSLWAFQEKLDALGHFYTQYKTVADLCLHFTQQLDKLVASGFIEFKPDRGDAAAGSTYHANLTGDGAIAQGAGARAVGARGVLVGGNNSGNISTGTHTNIQTGGGAYIGGNVGTGGGDFVGRDKVAHGINSSALHAKTINVFVGEQSVESPKAARKKSKKTVREAIRLDVASPSSVFAGVEFDVAVAIRQPNSPALTVDDLDNRNTARGTVERTSTKELARYRVEIRSGDFAVDPAKVIFDLQYGVDSEIKWFKLIAKRSGRLTFIVLAYQVEDDVEVASTRVALESVVESRPVSPGHL